MAKRLFYKVRAALSIILVTVALMASGQSYDFIKGNSKITFFCKSMRMEEVFERLSHQADVYFIYSTSILELNKLMTVSAKQQPLNELLKQIGQEMNLTFRYEGKYIIVKKNKALNQTISKSLIKPASAPAKSESLFKLVSYDSSGRKAERYYAPKELIFTSLNSFVPVRRFSIDSTSLLNMIVPANSQTSKKWFVSMGIIANDHTRGGVEIRGGLKYAYAIFNTAYVNDGNGLYRIGYGGGSSIPIMRKMALNLSYNYSRMKKETSVYSSNPRHPFIEKSYQATLKHNQFKVLLQYNLTRHIDINLGTSLNLLYTKYQWQNTYPQFNTVVVDKNTTAGAHTSRAPYSSYSFSSVTPTVKEYNENFQDSRTIKVWPSWEIGIFYRINL